MQARQYQTKTEIQFRTALLTLLMMTAESVLSKRPVLRITEIVFFFLKLISDLNFMMNVFHARTMFS